MKVAFTTSTGIEVDMNFRKSMSFTIWDVGPDEAYYVTTVRIADDAECEDDRIAARVKALSDCSIVCSREINGPAAAKLAAGSIHSLKTGVTIPVEEIIGRLKKMLRGTQAPWMRKARIGDPSAAGGHDFVDSRDRCMPQCALHE